MPPTRQEYLSLFQQESVGRQHQPSHDTALGIIKTAAVSFEHLTNTPEWDRFLSYLQAIYEDEKKERDTWRETCGYANTDHDIRYAQHKFHGHQAAVVLLEKIMGLPRQVMESYQALK